MKKEKKKDKRKRKEKMICLVWYEMELINKK